jgi:type II secretion system protein N
MKKRLFLVGGLLAAALALVFALALWLVSSIDTPELKSSILERVSSAAGARARARQVDIALLHGITLRGVTVANPPPFSGDILSAEAFILRYRLWPLLSGRLELARLSLEKPVLTLSMDARGAFNYEKLGGSAGPPASHGKTTSIPIELVLSKLGVSGARIVVRDAKAAYVTVENAGLDSSFVLSGDQIEGKGRLSADTVDLADALYVRRLAAPLAISKGTLALTPVRARLAGGALAGEARLRLSDLRFSADVSLRKAELRMLLEEARTAQSASGWLSAEAKIEGGSGLSSLKGRGELHVDDCKVAHAPLMTLLAGLLGVPELEHPEFQECRVEFTLGRGRATVPVLRLKGSSVELAGHGVTRLDSMAIDYDMTMALSRKLLDRVPVRELRAAFTDRGDGFGTVAFKVTGTAAAPRTDLASRVGKAAASEAAGNVLKKLFGGRKIF